MTQQYAKTALVARGTAVPERKTDGAGSASRRSGAVRADALGDRMKDYERRESGRRVMRGLPVVVRVDGRSFSRFTRGMARPYDTDLADLMVEVARYLVEQTNGRIALTQSDEVSLILDPFDGIGSGAASRVASAALDAIDADDPVSARVMMSGLRERGERGAGRLRDGTDLMFGGRCQKLCSVIAGLATARFVMDAVRLWPDRCARQLPVFDARAFEVPDRDEAVAALVWRELDATKNAVSMAARAYFPHARLQGKSAAEMQEMLFRDFGVNFNDYPARFRRGAYVQRRMTERRLEAAALARIPERLRPSGPVMRMATVVLDLPPIRRIANPVEVLLDAADPILFAASQAA